MYHHPRNGGDRLWAIVLAAGEGRRLSSLTRAIYGYDLPKQFACLDGDASLLQATLERVAPLVPAERTVVVVPEPHVDLARVQLEIFPGVEIVAQPRNLDTAPGLLLPLARVLSRDPRATVAVFPSDHHIAAPGTFLHAVEFAASCAGTGRCGVSLVGVPASAAEEEYGWIVPGRTLAGSGNPRLFEIQRFVEKPPRRTAARLAAAGGLWNTFVSIGSAAALWALAEVHLAEHAASFAHYLASIGTREETSVLRGIYGAMPPANWSRGVLEHAEDLAVVRIANCGWCDLGSPERVFAALGGCGRLAGLAGSMIAAAAGA